MKCCDDYGHCTQGQNCPSVQVTRPGDLSPRPTEPINRLERLSFPLLLILVYVASAVISVGTLSFAGGVLWGKYERPLTHLWWSFLTLVS